MAPPAAMLAWLQARLGTPAAWPRRAAGEVASAAARPLPELGCAASDDPHQRLAYSRGQGFPDLVRLRSGTVATLPDAVAWPASEEELTTLLARAAAGGVVVIPWGGGTSVTGGVNPPAGERPVVSVDLGGLAGCEHVDPTSRLATFGAGSRGPQIEAALAPHGLTLGHFPQSFELSTLGGWIATRSSGQESLGYGGIDSLVAGLELVAPGGRLSLAPQPASAAGPDLRQLILGSEGRLGIVTRATVRVRPRPPVERLEAALLPDWQHGAGGARALVQEGVPLTLLRLSDEPETEVALAAGLARPAIARVVRGYLRLRGIRGTGCLLLLGAAGDHERVDGAFDRARRLLRRHGAAWLGEGPGRHWRRDRFRHPYLRDALLDRGIATDTLETAAPWSRLDHLYAAVRAALAAEPAAGERQIPVLCHLSHPYRDGASLYFTWFFRCPRDPQAAIARWAAMKRRATDAVLAAGGTVSHHHGVGSFHAPWLAREIGATGHALLTAAARVLDPDGVVNPHVLLDPEDRLAD